MNASTALRLRGVSPSVVRWAPSVLFGAIVLGMLLLAAPAYAVSSPLLSAAALVAQTESSDEAVEAGREALRKSANFPWYDPETEQLRPVHLRARRPPEVDPPRPPRSGESDSRSARSEPWDATWVQWAAWTAIAILLAALAAALVHAYLTRDRRTQKTVEANPAAISDQTGALPFDAPLTKGDLLSEARRYYQAGNFQLAIIYLYSHQLLQLDKHHRIRLLRGKTNREYLRELSPGPIRPLLEQTMVAFEDVFFGGHALPRERFEACWREVDHFDHLARQVAA